MYRIYTCENVKKYKDKIYKYNYFRLISYDENRTKTERMFKTYELALEYASKL